MALQSARLRSRPIVGLPSVRVTMILPRQFGHSVKRSWIAQTQLGRPTRHKTMPTRTASCACGQLTATVTGEPVRNSVCHYHACQRPTGSVFGAQARFHATRCKCTGERANSLGSPIPERRSRSVLYVARRCTSGTRTEKRSLQYASVLSPILVFPFHAFLYTRSVCMQDRHARLHRA